MPEMHEIIIRPLVTEKSTNLMNWNNQYVFLVNPEANKIDVQRAVQSRWAVKVESVQIINQMGKARRLRLGRLSKQPDWKKAIVKLAPDNAIDVF